MDEKWMQLAIEQARRGLGCTSPNPPVGAVIVRGGTLLGSGWHRGAGHPHAEREALTAALAAHGSQAVRGATVYVTLEPCSTTGRTGPCTDALVNAGIGRVVWAAQDPTALNGNRAAAVFTQAGIAFRSGVLAKEAGELIRGFSKANTSGLPWVIWKLAMSLDGRIVRPSGEEQWLSGPLARADVQKLRAEVDAIVTSGQTVRADRPRLTLREGQLEGRRRFPQRLIITRSPLSLPRDAPIFTDCSNASTRVLEPGAGGLRELFTQLAQRDYLHTILLEAGGQLAAALAQEGLIDELIVYLTPHYCGGGAAALSGAGFPRGLRLRAQEWQQLGPDLRLRALF